MSLSSGADSCVGTSPDSAGSEFFFVVAFFSGTGAAAATSSPYTSLILAVILGLSLILPASIPEIALLLTLSAFYKRGLRKIVLFAEFFDGHGVILLPKMIFVIVYYLFGGLSIVNI